jgi:hypothetical protein
MRGASEQQIVADYSSTQVKIPAEFWADLKERKLIEQDAPVPVWRARGARTTRGPCEMTGCRTTGDARVWHF